MLDMSECRVMEILSLDQKPNDPVYGPNDAVSTEFATPYPPVIKDLARLYRLVRARKVTTVLELGSGYSTAVIAADIARMEWLLLPGTMIVIDGRTNNARFLKANFQRDWRYEHDSEGDVHIFELIEPPLGDLNRKQLEFSQVR